MTKPIWMPFYVADYLADTQHLTTIQHGAYMLMLMSAWKHGGELPSDDEQLAEITKFSQYNWKKHKQVLLKFFSENNGVLVQKRLISEYDKSAKIQERSKTNGAKGGRPKKNPGVISRLTQNEPRNNLGGNLDESKSQSQVLNTSTKDVLSTLSVANATEVNGVPVDHQIPACPQKEIIALYHEHLPLCPHVREWNNVRQGFLRTRWREKAQERHWTSKEQGLEMFAKLFDFIGESKFLTGKAEPKPGRPPFLADLEWIVRPTNWAKIIEGKYHHDPTV